MKRYILILSVVFAALTVSAQEVIWKATYDVSFPFSSTKEFTDQVSWRGVAVDFDRFIGESFAVGMGFSWSTFLEKEPDSYYQRSDILLFGTQVRYINTVPMVVRFSYYKSLDLLELYGSMGVGTAWQETRRDMGLYSFVGNYWQFAVTPEVGVIFPVGRSYLTAKLRYVQGFETEKAPSLSYLSVGLGFAW